VTVGATPRSRLLLFSGLYFAQGIPWGFFTVAIMLRLANLGMGPAAIGGVASTAWLPWTLKPLLGPLVDRVSLGRLGRRRGYILLAELGMALSLAAMALVDPATRLPLFSLLLFTHNLFAAAQDVGTDALAIHMLPAHERGSANGFMSAGKFAGVVVGGQGLLFVAHVSGWAMAYGVAIALLLVPALLVLPVHESDVRSSHAHLLRDALRILSWRMVLVAALFAIVVDASDSLLFPLVYPLLTKQLGFSEQQIATLSTLGGAVAAGSSILGGWLSDRLGRRATLLGSCLAVAVLDLAFMAAQSLWGSYGFQAGFAIVGAIVSGVVYASSLALFMDLTHPRFAATQFQVYMALTNTRGVWASRLGGWSAERVSAPRMFGIAAVVELVPLALLALLDPRKLRSSTETREDSVTSAPETRGAASGES
jgi:MFS transporter, PAT family, beta-lactamase induction signal transducer AmpG